MYLYSGNMMYTMSMVTAWFRCLESKPSELIFSLFYGYYFSSNLNLKNYSKIIQQQLECY